MIHYKSHKQTKTTFSLTFSVDKPEDVKKLKALAILLGAFNPFRNEASDTEALYQAMKKSKDEGEFENMVYDITELLK